MDSRNMSIAVATSFLVRPVLLAMSSTISAFVIDSLLGAGSFVAIVTITPCRSRGLFAWARTRPRVPRTPTGAASPLNCSGKHEAATSPSHFETTARCDAVSWEAARTRAHRVTRDALRHDREVGVLTRITALGTPVAYAANSAAG